MKKQEIIDLIANRIKREETKHSHSITDWHLIAANKIYDELFPIYSKVTNPSKSNMLHKRVTK